METGETCWRLFLEGDDGAFDEVVRLYRLPLIRFLTSYLHDPYAAEDVAADCFAFLLAHPKRYDFRTGLKTYLFMLARSRAIDRLRREKRLVFVEPEAPVLLSAEGEGPETVLEERERRQALRKALQSLPENEKQAVQLVYFEELTYKEAGKVLKLGAKQVDYLLTKAKRRLKAALGETGETL